MCKYRSRGESKSVFEGVLFVLHKRGKCRWCSVVCACVLSFLFMFVTGAGVKHSSYDGFWRDGGVLGVL